MFYRYEHYMSISHMALIVAMEQHVNLCIVILYLEMREPRSLYVHTCIFEELFLGMVLLNTSNLSTDLFDA